MLIDQSFLSVKGAPDILIERCTSILMPDGTVAPLTSDVKSRVLLMKDEWSMNGKRVILLARKLIREPNILPEPGSPDLEAKMMEELQGGLTLVSLLGIVDPPRQEIPEVVKTLHGAGIRVFMVRSPCHYWILYDQGTYGFIRSLEISDSRLSPLHDSAIL